MKYLFLLKPIGSFLNLLHYINKNLAGKIGFKIWCYPINPKLTKFHQQYLNNSVVRDFELNDNKIKYYQWGNGSKKILFLHGWASNSFRWKSYIDEFSKHHEFTIFALDAPGSGNSQGKILNLPIYVEAIKKLISIIGNPHTVITHSFGGFAALMYLYENKDQQFDKLITMGAPAHVKDFIELFKAQLNLSDNTMNDIINYFERKTKYKASFFSTFNYVPYIKTKGLIVHDVDDKDTNYHDSVELSKLWTNSTLYTTTGLGHTLKSKKLIEDVIAFCKS